MYAPSDGACRRRDRMTRRARDGGLYCSDGFVAGACVFLVRYGVIDSDKARVLGLVYGNAVYDAARPRWGIVLRGWTHRGRVCAFRLVCRARFV